MGLGTQDSLDLAERFRRDTGVEHQLVWDPSGESWRYFEIVRQPSAVLVAPDGSTLATWRGPVPFDAVLEALAAAGSG